MEDDTVEGALDIGRGRPEKKMEGRDPPGGLRRRAEAVQTSHRCTRAMHGLAKSDGGLHQSATRTAPSAVRGRGCWYEPVGAWEMPRQPQTATTTRWSGGGGGRGGRDGDGDGKGTPGAMLTELERVYLTGSVQTTTVPYE